jgi:hypothetical protein
MVPWSWNTEVLGSLWLMASATWGEITSNEGLHDWGRRAVPFFFNYNLVLALQLRKCTEYLNQGSRVVGDYSLADLADFLRTDSPGLRNISPPRLLVDDFSQSLDGTGAFQVVVVVVPRIS